MKLTAQEEYGLRCLLRVADSGEGQSLTIPEIGQVESLSIAYVATLMRFRQQPFQGIVNTADPRTCPFRKRSRALFASASGKASKNVRTDAFGALLINSSASFLVRFATEHRTFNRGPKLLTHLVG